MGQKCNPILMRAGKIDKVSINKVDKTVFGYKRYNFYAENKTEYSRRLNNAILIEQSIKNKFRDTTGDIYIGFAQKTAIVDIFSTEFGGKQNTRNFSDRNFKKSDNDNAEAENSNSSFDRNAQKIENIVENIKKDVLKIAKNDNIEVVKVNFHGIKKPELDASIVCRKICREIEKKRGNANIKKYAETSMKFGAEGIKINMSGRISGAEIARSDKVSRGKINATTLKANISYAQSVAKTQYGIIGVSVFINVSKKPEDASNYKRPIKKYNDFEDKRRFNESKFKGENNKRDNVESVKENNISAE